MRRSVIFLGAAAVLALCCAAPTNAGGGKKVFFNGQDTTGWEGLPEYWSVKDGAIVGSAPNGLKFNTFLVSKTRYRNFELALQVKMTGKGWTGNSGVQFRSELKDKEKFVVWGPQADMGAQYWGSLYGERFGGKKPGDGVMIMVADPKLVKRNLKENEFNDFYVKVLGKHVTIKLNNATTVDGDFAVLPDDGVIAFQLHAGNAMEVIFRNIQFTELAAKK